MVDNPLVSVCIPTYNNAQYIGKTLKSIINQTYKNIEIIVSDNASTDNTENIIKSFTDSRIYYYRNEIHLVTGEENYNECIKRSSGELIAIYHSDDIYNKNIVSTEVEFLTKYHECGAVFTLADKINENGNYLGNVWIPTKFNKGGIFNLYEIFMTLLFYGSTPLICPSVMLRRSVINLVGLFDSKRFGTSADTEMWFRILEKYSIGIIGKRLINYRISKNQGSWKYNYLRTVEADFLKVADKFINSDRFTAEQRIRLKKEYDYQKKIENTYRLISYYIIKKDDSARELLKNSMKWSFFLKCLRSFRGIKYLTTTIIISLGIYGRLDVVIRYIVSKLYYYRYKK